IGETLRIEREKGMFFFLMDYAKSGAYVDRPARSLFIDGEIALMLGARRMAEEKPEYIPLLAERCEIIQASLTRHPNMLAESYPNECWIFDHLMALDALKLRDVLDGSDHSALIKQWIDLAKREKLHPATGLIHSALTLEGEILDGPEGTTIWIAAHCLKILDEDFAADQYARARREIGFDILGFGLAREWPASWHGRADIDSGPIIPIVGASAGSSGLAILGAAAFDDRQWLGELAASLNFAAFPRERDGALKYCASNQVGDAVMLYALTFGPLWQAVKEKDKR
ncbi:hypothetical protein HY256_02000, partial [Candidatus Sumerlaeota bacterium]|nr:hypothetical protein [Candidatus Sumerlaeota bacterium]